MMNINLKPLYSFLHKNNKDIINDDLLFVDEINNFLMDEDLIIQEKAKDAIFDIVLIGSGGTEKLFLKELNNLKEPLVILSTSKNNSLPACFEIKTYLENHNKLCFLLSGDESHIANMIKHIATIINAYNNLKDNRLGLIGGPSSWLIASPVDAKSIHINYKQNIVKIKMSELEELIDETEKEMLDINEFAHSTELINKAEDQDVLHLALVIYKALKKLVKKYQLDGLTIRCFDILKKYKNTACLALALLNEEGITAGCEGDVPSLITMHIVNKLTNRSAFMANPSKFNYEDHSLMLAHCTVPLNMVTSFKLMTHFESGLGIGVKGELPEGRITLCKIAPDYSLENTLCIPANLKENLSLEGYCRTQISVALGEEGLLEILKASFGNHIIVCYGDVYQDFLPLLSLLRR
jgi:L-fucose isomerase-like protein